MRKLLNLVFCKPWDLKWNLKFDVYAWDWEVVLEKDTKNELNGAKFGIWEKNRVGNEFGIRFTFCVVGGGFRHKEVVLEMRKVNVKLLWLRHVW